MLNCTPCGTPMVQGAGTLSAPRTLNSESQPSQSPGPFRVQSFKPLIVFGCRVSGDTHGQGALSRSLSRSVPLSRSVSLSPSLALSLSLALALSTFPYPCPSRPHYLPLLRTFSLGTVPRGTRGDGAVRDDARHVCCAAQRHGAALPCRILLHWPADR